jgi:uncharacterized protein YcfJ
MGTFSAQVDTVAPDITGVLAGINGDNGWFISDATLSAKASDTTSGLASFDVAIDGGAFTAYTSSIALSEGMHTVQLQAQDNAGNTANITQTVNVDTTAPQVSLSGNNTFCPACGEKLTFAIAARDSLSGIAEWMLDVDGTVIQTGASDQSIVWDGGNLSAGNHTLTLRAKDMAGNTSETSLTVTLLSPTPTATATSVPLPTATSTSSSSTSSNPVVIFLPSKTPTTAPPITPTKTPQPTKTQSVVAFGKTPTPTATTQVIAGSQFSSSPVTSSTTNAASPILWGAAAAAMFGTVTVYALDEQRKRKQEEANQRADAEAKAAQLNAAEETRKAQNWLAGKATLDAALKQAAAFGATSAEIAAIKAQAAQQGIASALNAAQTVSEAAQIRAAEQAQWIEEQDAKNAQYIQDWQALEKQKAEEAKQAEQTRQKALQDHMACEHADSSSIKPNLFWTFVGGIAGAIAGGVTGYRLGGLPGVIAGGVIGGIAGIYAGNTLDNYGPNPIRTWFGLSPDYRGLRFVSENYTDQPSVSITTASSIAMQYQWNQNPLETFVINPLGSSPSFGPAQISQKELEDWMEDGLWQEAWDVNNAHYAAIAMDNRIQRGLNIFSEKCERKNISCTPLDNLFVTAVVQNNGGMNLSLEGQKSFDDIFYFTRDGVIQWHDYAATPKTITGPWSFFLSLRTLGQNYDRQFMMRQYYNDLIALHQNNPVKWPLPEGITDQELEYFRCVGKFNWPWETTPCVRP